MGYHIIIANNSKFETYYIDNIRELSYIDGLNEESLIYEGKETDKPYILKEYGPAKDYLKKIARIGALGEDLFEKQAKENKFVFQKYDQSQSGFSNYIKSLGANLKRPDFIIINASVDVDVKCISVYDTIEYGTTEECIYLKVKEINFLYEFSKHSNKPIVFAIYKQENFKPLSDKLYMIGVNDIIEKNEAQPLKIKIRNNEKSYIIPLSLATPGFELLEKFRKTPES